jgi:hypothetical protein
MEDQSVASTVTGQGKINSRYKPVPRMEFKSTIPEFERWRAIHGFERATTVIGKLSRLVVITS